MYTIDTENTKKIRHKMEVICGLDAASGVTGTVTATGTYALGNDKIQDVGLIPKLADLAGDGFALDGSRVYYSDPPDELTKYGYQSADIANEDGDLSAPLVITVTASDIGEVTIIFEEMSTFGFSYQLDSEAAVEADVADRIMLDCTGYASLIITIDKWAPGSRAKLARIFMGKCYQFNNNNLTSCIATLRAGLTLDPALPLSEIEIQGHITNDISEEIPYIPDNSPIWYLSGYVGDMCDIKKFYLQENTPMEYNEKIAVIKGYDQTYKLDSDFSGKYVSLDEAASLRDMYRLYKTILTEAGMTYDAEAEPAAVGMTGQYNDCYLFKGGTRRDVIAFMQNVLPIRFVDAGRPYLYHSADRRNTWTINDYSSIENEIEQHVSRIDITGYGAIADDAVTTIETEESAAASSIYEKSFSDYYTGITVTNATIISKTLNYVKFKATADGDCVVKGYKVQLFDNILTTYVSDGKQGTELDWTDKWDVGFDIFTSASESKGYADYISGLFSRSNIKKKFTWKGNPKMMPYDIVYLGSDETPYTVESMTLEHSGGGLTSQIEARKGVI